MSIDPHAYTISIQKVNIDNESYFEATVKELPDIREYGDTYQYAYDLAIDTIQTAFEMIKEAGAVFPMPLTKQADYSGRVTLRMPKSLHASITTIAEQEGVSLNQFVVIALAEYTGRRIGECYYNNGFSAITHVESAYSSTIENVVQLKPVGGTDRHWGN